MTKIKVTLLGQGGELDCRVIEIVEGADEAKAIRDAVQDIVINCELAAGDKITIEEI